MYCESHELKTAWKDSAFNVYSALLHNPYSKKPTAQNIFDLSHTRHKLYPLLKDYLHSK